MILANRKKLKLSTSLNAQIKEAEQQLLLRRQSISLCSNKLINDIHRQMTAPASLILAGSVGFVSGELSRCPSAKLADTASRPLLMQVQDLKTAFSLILSAYTLYNTLPVAKLRKYFHHSKKTEKLDVT
jgi:hypothetical protein